MFRSTDDGIDVLVGICRGSEIGTKRRRTFVGVPLWMLVTLLSSPIHRLTASGILSEHSSYYWPSQLF